MDIESKERELADLREQVSRLESEVAAGRPVVPFKPTGFYTDYFATAGFILGLFGAVASLLFNFVGSLMFGKSALHLIQVYLTFPLGDKALEFTSDDQGMILAFGCCLYIGTGMLLGVPFYVVLAKLTQKSSVAYRLVVATVLSLLLWIVNYYVILKYMQPSLIEMSPENYIVNLVPVWVAAATHLVFGWTIALLYPLGQFTSAKQSTDSV